MVHLLDRREGYPSAPSSTSTRCVNQCSNYCPAVPTLIEPEQSPLPHRPKADY
jgi:hypothetical protein